MKTAVQRKVEVIDAADAPLGRLASRAAVLLIGKHKANYAPNADAGDFVHIKNAAKIKLTGKKRQQKVYKWYTGYQGGLRTEPLKSVIAKSPAEVIKKAVKNMLPKNTFQTPRLRRLRITD
ncbi:50S ribosomal protein L13 [Patescibacteria group bacterium]|nr:MAG: 50S ribosomal protein L13 [Patescibacteria group bacterium]